MIADPALTGPTLKSHHNRNVQMRLIDSVQNADFKHRPVTTPVQRSRQLKWCYRFKGMPNKLTGKLISCSRNDCLRRERFAILATPNSRNQIQQFQRKKHSNSPLTGPKTISPSVLPETNSWYFDWGELIVETKRCWDGKAVMARPAW